MEDNEIRTFNIKISSTKLKDILFNCKVDYMDQIEEESVTSMYCIDTKDNIYFNISIDNILEKICVALENHEDIIKKTIGDK